MGDITYIDKHRQSAGDTQEDNLGSIHCLVININTEQLLLPNAAVAEVVNYSDPETVDGAPDWLLGLITWRDRRIPVVSFERVSQSEAEFTGSGERIVICNSLNGNRNVPYVGIVAQGIPHLHLIKEADLNNAAEISAQQCVALQAVLQEENILIPNLDDIESRIEALQS